jgi:hypothetical protein
VRHLTSGSENHATTSAQANRAPRRALALSKLRTRPAVSRRFSNAPALYRMRPFVFSRAGILPRSDDHQLHSHHGRRRGHISVVTFVSGFHRAIDQFQNPAVDGIRHRSLFDVDAPRVQLLARHRFLDQAQAAGPSEDGEILEACPEVEGNDYNLLPVAKRPSYKRRVSSTI